jgi:REP element-mobilizing transposase RayT
MGWPLRMYHSREIYFVTVRCIQGRLLLRPSRETNEVLAGVLARGARLCSVELFGFVFASNHFHLVVRAPEGNLPRFMQFLLSNISKKVGWISNWRGSFWERRYSSQPILDDEALLGRIRYILAHGVKERLVRRCAEWPGLSSLTMLLGDATRSAKWFNWTRRWNNRQTAGRDRFADAWVEEEQLTLTILPQLAARPLVARRRIWQQAVRAIEKEASLDPSPVLGVRAVLAQSPHSRPARPARRPRPLCHASTRGLRELFRERYRTFVAEFLQASAQWRRGFLDVVFPEGAIRPFLWARPHLAAA